MKLQPNIECLDEIWDKYRTDYAGKWISTAWQYYGNGLYPEATESFEKARNSFGQKSVEWQCLEAWHVHAGSKIKTSKSKTKLTK